ncbi:MAG: GIY-YIG nuclease family protein [Bacteroidales bacterium]|nr:GIY-YIG nuclease family protein [Bacteroidales bacterium]
MKELTIKDFIAPSILDDISSFYFRIEFDINNKKSIRFYSKGEVFGEMTLGKVLAFGAIANAVVKSNDIPSPTLVAPLDGIYDFTVMRKNLNSYGFTYTSILTVKQLIENKIIICNWYEDYDDYVENYLKNTISYNTLEDAYTNTKQIVWKCVYNSFGIQIEKDGFQLRFSRSKGGCLHSESIPYIKLMNSKQQFVFIYHKKDFSTHKFKKGDVFHFLFVNGTHIEYQLKTSPSNTNDADYKQVSFSLLPQDIVLFAAEQVNAIRCTFENGDEPLDLYPENEIASLSFKFYFQKFEQALSECGVDLESCSSEESIKTGDDKNNEPTWKDSTCFVYLMKDESNGFYKIGISNKPEYRERTLQSEKPTIVLLKSKEFPTRTIAEAIESALHKAYGDKRLRGEWFELDEKDVNNIIATLS